MSDQPPDARLPSSQGSDSTLSGATSSGPRWRGRVWSLPAVIAVVLATVIIGGLGGVALAAVSDDGRDGSNGPGQSRAKRDGRLCPPGLMKETKRERCEQWRQKERRQGQGRSQRDGHPCPPGLMKEGKRERCEQWLQKQRRQGREDSLPSPTPSR